MRENDTRPVVGLRPNRRSNSYVEGWLFWITLLVVWQVYLVAAAEPYSANIFRPPIFEDGTVPGLNFHDLRILFGAGLIGSLPALIGCGISAYALRGGARFSVVAIFLLLVLARGYWPEFKPGAPGFEKLSGIMDNPPPKSGPRW